MFVQQGRMTEDERGSTRIPQMALRTRNPLLQGAGLSTSLSQYCSVAQSPLCSQLCLAEWLVQEGMSNGIYCRVYSYMHAVRN
jgi:hypothetical protein